MPWGQIYVYNCWRGGPYGGVVDKLNYDTARVFTHRPPVAIKQVARCCQVPQLSVKPLWGPIHAVGAEKCLPPGARGGPTAVS